MTKEWQDARTHVPAGQPGKWSKRVVCQMQSGDFHVISYFHSDTGGSGCWQRLARTAEGDRPILWSAIAAEPVDAVALASSSPG